MKFAGFDHRDAAGIFREHAALSALDNDGARDFDIGALAGIEAEAFDALEPFQWPWRAGSLPQARFFAEGRFYTPDGRGRMLPVAEPRLASPADGDRPFILNTGRVRDHWHTMTRTGKSVKLARHVAEPTIAVHPLDARELGVAEGAYLRVESAHGAATLRCVLDVGLARGSAFAPFHWNDATSGLSRVDAVAQPKTDPVSGQPELKATPVSLTPVAMACEGVLLARHRVSLPKWLQHTRITVPGGEALLFASTREALSLHALLLNHLGEAPRRAGMLDPDARQFRTVSFADGRLSAALFVGPRRDAATIDWLIEAFAKERLEPREIKAVLAGQPPSGAADAGPMICSCFAVRRAAIEAAVRDGAADVDAVGAALKAGTNCGSCRPEIKRVIHDHQRTPGRTAAA